MSSTSIANIVRTGLTLALATLPSCGHGAEQSEESRAAAPVRTTLPLGDPTFGRVTFLMQHHFAGAPTERELTQIGRAQAALLRELHRIEPEQIFQEGQADTLAGRTLEEHISGSRIRELFSADLPREFTQEQLRVLAHEGAALVYAAIRPGVTIQPTARPTFEREIHARIAAAPDEIERSRLVMEVREAECIAVIRSLLQATASRHSAVIFGENHTTLPEKLAQTEHPPAIDVVTWPNRADSAVLSLELAKMTDPSQQLAAVRRAEFILDCVFSSLLTEEARALALPKLDVKFENVPRGAAELKETLDLFCQSKALKGAVQAHADQGTGPFLAFTPFAITSRISDAAPEHKEMLICAAPYLQCWLFRYLTEAQQFLAVTKLVQDDYQPGEAVDLPIAELRSGAKSPRVRDAIDARASLPDIQRPTTTSNR